MYKITNLYFDILSFKTILKQQLHSFCHSSTQQYKSVYQCPHGLQYLQGVRKLNATFWRRLLLTQSDTRPVHGGQCCTLVAPGKSGWRRWRERCGCVVKRRRTVDVFRREREVRYRSARKERPAREAKVKPPLAQILSAHHSDIQCLHHNQRRAIQK